MPSTAVDGLKCGRAVLSSVDPLAEEVWRGGAIDRASPAGGTPCGEAVGVTRLDHRLAATVAELLAKVRAQPAPAVMPH